MNAETTPENVEAAPAEQEPTRSSEKTSILTINILVAVLVIGGMAAQNLFYTVQPDERAVITRFGAVIGQAGPGLHFKLPFGIDEVQKVPTERVLKQKFGFPTESSKEGDRAHAPIGDDREEREMLTGDLNMIDVSWVVQYQIRDPVEYLYQLKDPERSLRDVSEAVIRRLVGMHPASDVLTTGGGEISLLARDEIQKAMTDDASGIHVTAVELHAVVPPERVRSSFNEVNQARQEREQMINDAIKQKNQAIPKAIGEAKRTIAEAEAYAIERVNRAKGDVARFQAILKEYERAPEVTRRRLYLEALREVAPKAGKIIVVQDGDSHPQSFLHLNEQSGDAQK
ncbi:FtsH protease activity modulator HflK [Polyangium mundeleinium]|uniref:Protein HflK n=1 Tax=Polyangium mundeleinium TaxID=2995306 RepID=A0ABT5F5V4_9BACT|nr:FtsH protease activity modulator HflK [Polyangium mundeleinium]MDC0748979.1 FtsH protease activity modulator HflK [Polyangium mundeleinium]